MEKILKRLLLLIPILIIAFPLKNVYADEPINIYADNPYSSTLAYRFVPESNRNYVPKFTFNAFNNSFKYNIDVSKNKNYYYNTFILYDNINNIYIINTLFSRIFENRYNSERNINLQCKLTENNTSTHFQYYNTENEFINYSSFSYPTFLSINSPNISLYNSYFHQKYNREVSFDNYYLQYFGSSFATSLRYCENIDNFDLVYINGGKFYVDGVEKKKVVPYVFNNTKYYVPNYNERNCVEIIDKDTIRVFDNEETLNYTDYYINSNYISKTGQVEVTYVKNCSNLQFTNIRYYGNDFPQILFITLVVITFSVGFPYILYKRFRKR